MTDWAEVADGVWHARYHPIDISTVLVRGDDGLLLVDTRCNPREAAELRADVDALKLGPIRWVVNTHAHYDHSFGNQEFGGTATIYGHRRIPAHFRDFEQPRLDVWTADPAAQPQYDWADVVLTPPHELLGESRELDLGGRAARLIPLPPGHTDTDLVVHIPDADCWIVGDIVEESGPPMFGSGSFPFTWPQVIRDLAAEVGGTDVVIPGHGKAVDRRFMLRQAAELGAVADAITAAHAERLGVAAATTRIAADSGLPEEIVEPAVRRGFAQLGGATP
ncbi:glyoxylase-like metal-dependent hydrolase (beta-lactamase superfamily II) [Microterricola gilva]|uniref:Glyoxylase-like metal-dependent hydrolase (Beta-lactamase superfamily II) n=1 Tax=Microterricola gilva TaxID=393267 RepID=A0A4Q8AL77_9MICO|nr:MBL fold metallo-hydrolase [Microterricola gilva]RZU65188.1 glyoxylase-like metal-dependent hydrolase (beta-lactamase superfamily II) [Microterricola gilva]